MRRSLKSKVPTQRDIAKHLSSAYIVSCDEDWQHNFSVLSREEIAPAMEAHAREFPGHTGGCLWAFEHAATVTVTAPDLTLA